MYIAQFITGIALMAVVAVEAAVMWRERTMDVGKLIEAETKLINKMLDAHGIKAKTTVVGTLCIKSSFISYRLKVAYGEKIGKIEAIQRELANELTKQRNRSGLRDIVPVRFSDYPLALEVPHPAPTTLQWDMDTLTSAPKDTMTVGRSYYQGNAQTEKVCFNDTPHALVVGITNAGKSVLLQNMMLSLCYNTPPSELEIVLIDLKNEDMIPFKRLPHVAVYAGDKETAIKAIEYVVAEKKKRTDRVGYKPYRIVLWIDELAQLAGIPSASAMLGDLASIGRSKKINLVGATQYPTEKGGLGGLLKANFPIRLVGMVAPGQSHIATGRPQIHADMLPGKGSFLRLQGPQAVRFQSYNIGEDDVVSLVGLIGEKYNAPAKHDTITSETPLMQAGPAKTEVEKLADMIAVMYASGASKNAMSKHAFNLPYGGRHAAKIDAAIAVLVRESSSGASSESSPNASSVPAATSQNGSPVLVEEDRNKIIKMFPRKVG